MGMDIKQLSAEIAKEMNYVKKWIAIRTATKMRNKLIKVYETIIDEFYRSHQPTSYRRHDVEPFTTEGINLYRALQSSYGVPPKLQPSANTIDGGIALSADDMAGRNYHVSKETVLDYVLHGVRFPGLGKSPELLFSCTYDDEDCHAEGTPLEILEQVKDQLATKYSNEAKNEARKELILKYVDIS